MHSGIQGRAQSSPGSSPSREGYESPRLSFASDTDSISNPIDALRSVYYQLIFMRAAVLPSSSSLASSTSLTASSSQALSASSSASASVSPFKHSRSGSTFSILSPSTSPLMSSASAPPPFASPPLANGSTGGGSGGGSATSSDVLMMIESLLVQLEPFVVDPAYCGNDSPSSVSSQPGSPSPSRVEITVDPPVSAYSSSRRPSSAAPSARNRRASQSVARRRGSRLQASHIAKGLPIPVPDAPSLPSLDSLSHASSMGRHRSQSTISRRPHHRFPRGVGATSNGVGAGVGGSPGIGRLMKRRRLGPVTRSMTRRMEEEKFREDFVQQMVRSINPKEREAIDWVEMMFLGSPGQLSETASRLQRRHDASAASRLQSGGGGARGRNDENDGEQCHQSIVPARAVVSACRFGLKLLNSTKARIARALSMPPVASILEKLGTWEFDALALGEHTDKPLSLVMKKLFDDLHFRDSLNIKADKFFAYIDAVEEKYHDVPYHNRFHATDVVANMYFWSRSPAFRRFIASDLDLLIALVAAAVHDVGHPGTSNEFQVNTRSKWAVLYNDQSVLENMHCSTAIQLLSEDKYNFCEDMCAKDVKQVRETIIAMVLSTDMHKHRENVQDLQGLIDRLRDETGAGSGAGSGGSGSGRGSPPGPKRKSSLATASTSKTVSGSGSGAGKRTSSGKKRLEVSRADRFTLLKSGLHAADVAVPTKQRTITVKWTDKLFEEFYEQGDIERENDLPISPSMDRSKPNVEVAQLKFCEWILQPLFSRWEQIIPEGDICLVGLKTNVEKWETAAKLKQALPASTSPKDADTHNSGGDAKPSASTTRTSQKMSSPVVNMDVSESRVVPPRVQSPRDRRHRIPARHADADADADLSSPSADDDLASSDSSYSPPTPTVDDDDLVDVPMSDADASSAVVCRTLRRRQRLRQSSAGTNADSMSDDETLQSPNVVEPSGSSASSPSAPSPSPKTHHSHMTNGTEKPPLNPSSSSTSSSHHVDLRRDFESELKEESDGDSHLSPFSSPDMSTTSTAGQRRRLRARKGRKRSRSPMSDGELPSSRSSFSHRTGGGNDDKDGGVLSAAATHSGSGSGSGGGQSHRYGATGVHNNHHRNVVSSSSSSRRGGSGSGSGSGGLPRPSSAHVLTRTGGGSGGSSGGNRRANVSVNASAGVTSRQVMSTSPTKRSRTAATAAASSMS